MDWTGTELVLRGGELDGCVEELLYWAPSTFLLDLLEGR